MPMLFRLMAILAILGILPMATGMEPGLCTGGDGAAETAGHLHACACACACHHLYIPAAVPDPAGHPPRELAPLDHPSNLLPDPPAFGIFHPPERLV